MGASSLLVDPVPTVATVGAPLRSAAERLYRELGPAVLAYLRAHAVDDPDDVLGEVFLQVTRDLPRFDGDQASLRRWVFAIAHNRIVDHHRRRHRRPRLVPASESEGAELADTRPVDHQLLDPVLVDALRTLTPEQRDVVVLRFVADLSIAEVAQLMGRRPGAVKALQSRALARLATMLQGLR
jgi:RNA polymerase sigma-70 factor (ECF subfamily)